MNTYLLIYLFHILVVAPLFFIVGEYRDHPKIKDNQGFWQIFTMLAIMTIVWHSYKAYLFL